MKKRIIIGLLILLAALFLFTRPECVVKGLEYETLTVDGVYYDVSVHDGLSIADKGIFLDLYHDGDTLFRIYKAKGYPDMEYVYVVHGWEGEFYKRQ